MGKTLIDKYSVGNNGIEYKRNYKDICRNENP